MRCFDREIGCGSDQIPLEFRRMSIANHSEKYRKLWEARMLEDDVRMNIGGARRDRSEPVLVQDSARVSLLLRSTASLAALAAWWCHGSAMFGFGMQGIGPENEFGPRQVVALLGSGAVFVLVAGAATRAPQWLVPRAVLLGMGAASAVVAYLSALLVFSAVHGDPTGAWAARHFSVLYFLAPIPVIAAAMVVRAARTGYRIGIGIVSVSALTVPAIAVVSVLLRK